MSKKQCDIFRSKMLYVNLGSTFSRCNIENTLAGTPLVRQSKSVICLSIIDPQATARSFSLSKVLVVNWSRVTQRHFHLLPEVIHFAPNTPCLTWKLRQYTTLSPSALATSHWQFILHVHGSTSTAPRVLGLHCKGEWVCTDYWRPDYTIVK